MAHATATQNPSHFSALPGFLLPIWANPSKMTGREGRQVRAIRPTRRVDKTDKKENIEHDRRAAEIPGPQWAHTKAGGSREMA